MSAEAQQQSEDGSEPPPQHSLSTYLTETSQLPIRSSNTRHHSTSARSTPYTLSSATSSHHYHSVGTSVVGDVANIPKTAQYRAVGMPARHPLGLLQQNTDAMQSDGSSADESNQDSSSSSEHGSPSTRLPTTLPRESELMQPDASSNNNNNTRIVCCPICLNTIFEAFMTACGHSFCHACIAKHLTERLTCPTCMQKLSTDQIYPNFALNQLIASRRSMEGASEISSVLDMDTISSNPLHVANIIQQIRSTLESNQDMETGDIDDLLSMLQKKKQTMWGYERQFEMTTMHQFLTTARSKKTAQIEALRKELAVVDEDLDYVGAQLDVKDTTVGQDSSRVVVTSPEKPSLPSSLSRNSSSGASNSHGAQVPSDSSLEEEEAENIPLPRNKRVDEHYSDLESFYFKTRISGNGNREGGGGSVDDFMETLSTFARHERFKTTATLRYGDSTASTAIVASIEFDRDEEIFAVAGVTRKIKIYDYANVLQQADTWNTMTSTVRRRRLKQQQQQQQQSSNEGEEDWWDQRHEDQDSETTSPVVDSGNDGDSVFPTALQYPHGEFTNRSKISCLSFNPYIKAQLACSDYDGTVSLWDVNAGIPTQSLGEHEKRAWSVDFSQVDPTRLCSGSDDGKVKIWTTNRRSSVLTIEGKANVCCVRFNPLHSNILSFGSADHNIHCFDLRSPKQPLCVLKGHRKAVSYTRFLSPDEIISASTDSSLKLWNMKTQECVRTFTGHSNEKNFVGLTTSGSEWIACGSENNTMYAYYRNLSRPSVTHKFGNCNPVTGVEQTEEDPSLFVSAVCWKNNTNTLLSANSQGIIKVLELE